MSYILFCMKQNMCKWDSNANRLNRIYIRLKIRLQQNVVLERNEMQRQERENDGRAERRLLPVTIDICL